MNLEIIKFFLDREILLSPEIVDKIKKDSGGLLDELKLYIENNQIFDCFIDKNFLNNLKKEEEIEKEEYWGG